MLEHEFELDSWEDLLDSDEEDLRDLRAEARQIGAIAYATIMGKPGFNDQTVTDIWITKASKWLDHRAGQMDEFVNENPDYNKIGDTQLTIKDVQGAIKDAQDALVLLQRYRLAYRKKQSQEQERYAAQRWQGTNKDHC